MKTGLLIVLGLFTTVCAFAQGTVAFANNSSTRVCLFSGGFVPVGNTFQAELMYAPDGTEPHMFDVMAIRLGNAASFGPIAGTFLGGTRTAPTPTPGGIGLFQVRVWETAYGTSYNDIIFRGDFRARIGKSDVIRVDTGHPTTVPPGTPVTLTGAGLTGFTVGAPLGGQLPCIPEPSSFLLALVGVGTFGLLRRKR